ncbi:MAG: hypothetical protein RL291_1950 [Pseudomonadota bacterium]
MADTSLSAPRGGISGWVEAGLYTLAVGALTVSYAVGHLWGAHPIAFILYAMIVSAVVMLAVTGLGADWREVMLAPSSWVVGGAIILVEIFYYLVLAHMAPAPGNLVVRIGIPLALIAGRVYVGRRQSWPAIFGAGLVTASVVYLLSDVQSPDRWFAALWGFLTAFSFVVRNIASEFHPWNRRAETLREKIRITGLVVLVTSCMGLAAFGLASLLQLAGVMPPTAFLPTLQQLMHGPTVLLGIIVGTFILTAMAYLNFSSVVKITTENVIAMTAFTPVAALLMEWLAVRAGLIKPTVLTGVVALAMTGAVAGALIIVFAQKFSRPRV